MKKSKSLHSFKLIIIILLLLALLPMPYGFYELLRFVAMVFFVYSAISCHRYKKENRMLTYIFLALLFQPFYKIALGRFIWNIVDVLVAIYLLYTINSKNKC